MSKEKERELVNKLIKNVDLSAWAPSDMIGINTKVVSHLFSMHPLVIPMAPRKRRAGKEKWVVVDEEVGKLCDTRFITKTKYLTWVANVVMIR